MNPFRRKDRKVPHQLTPQNHEVSTPMEAEAVSLDEEVSRLADSYSRIGEKKYVRTKTYRHPESVQMPDDSSLRNRIYVIQRGGSVAVMTLGPEKAGDGARRYLITPGDEGKLNVAVSDFTPRENLRGLLLEAPEGGVLKEIVNDKVGRVGTAEAGEVTWVADAGLFTDEQQMQMDLVGFALHTVEPHLAPGSSLRVLR